MSSHYAEVGRAGRYPGRRGQTEPSYNGGEGTCLDPVELRPAFQPGPSQLCSSPDRTGK